MKNSIFPVWVLLILIVMACSPVEAPQDNHADHDHTAMGEHGHGDSRMGAVQLDHGKTWEANPETTEGIQAMVAIVEGYDSATGDVAVLKEELQAEFSDIFAKCTMTGEAHDQLHNYLLPIKHMLDSLGNDPSDARLADLREYLGTYGNYFH